MQTLYSNQVASISELKKNPTRVISEAHGKPVAILNHNIPAAYLIPTETFEKLMDLIDEHELEKLVKHRLSDASTPIKVKLDDL
ncbi:MAG: type II toxin-antitoxin system prevent-host-death family antitoxin [Legionellaceae bacterium]|jgi:antitoxin StbD|nr:type II toxin-antitoxin system prevent-host-death family antitoxin [Legionellaceae bacterium]